jgi:hypothetical protein
LAAALQIVPQRGGVDEGVDGAGHGGWYRKNDADIVSHCGRRRRCPDLPKSCAQKHSGNSQEGNEIQADVNGAEKIFRLRPWEDRFVWLYLVYMGLLLKACKRGRDADKVTLWPSSGRMFSIFLREEFDYEEDCNHRWCFDARFLCQRFCPVWQH